MLLGITHWNTHKFKESCPRNHLSIRNGSQRHKPGSARDGRLANKHWAHMGHQVTQCVHTQCEGMATGTQLLPPGTVRGGCPGLSG